MWEEVDTVGTVVQGFCIGSGVSCIVVYLGNNLCNKLFCITDFYIFSTDTFVTSVWCE
jgi:hypothetical protein